jgi:arsenate reductase
MIRIYTYSKCDTCRKAVRFLREAGVAFEEIPIREQPPGLLELRDALAGAGGNLRALFNTSGMDYRAMGLGEKLATMSDEEALNLLASHGNLVKRPFLVGLGSPRAGFRATEWTALLEN